MTNITMTLNFTDTEVAYLLISLKRYEAQLLSSEDEDMEDGVTDLLFVQALQKKLQGAGEP
ncbi:hypothetical protein Q4S45_07335 [Massilia sp. R2A-15]|uniref:hypothetical protein n=1 Tax=Massilia sp. R2A-15 TaxID=3064278 RepID=UPI0027346B43|nr:hypothetical protein [Massilia sp. R2A-15]WLI90921.1 hypothetical protein Q4S45_07335 [Massilia sp. R2A-15]